MLIAVRMAAAATAVCGVVLGIAQVAHDPDASDVAVMLPTDEALLRGVGPGEALPVVPPEPDAPTKPRQVAGPVPLPVPAAAAAAPAAAAATRIATRIALVQSSRGIPGVVLAAYQQAARTMAVERPGCHLTWPLLAGIGRIESGHARNGDVDGNGTTRTPIVGPRLDGSGPFALVRDSDGGLWDADTTYDRAVGPMQFLPGTWRGAGRDANGDGDANPNNVADAALASAGYLCAGGADLLVRDDLLAAVFRYNRSWDYVSTVLTWAGIYATDGPVVTTGAPVGKGGKKSAVVVAAPAAEPVAETADPASTAPNPTVPVETVPVKTVPVKTVPLKTVPLKTRPLPEPTTTPLPPKSTPTPEPTAPAAASVAGRVRDDAARPVEGVPVTFTGPVTTTVHSAADGTFAAADLPPGEYRVRAGAATGYAAPGDDTAVTLSAGEHHTGLTLGQITSTLSGRVFVDDVEANGRDDTGEAGVAKVDVRLTGTDVRGRAVDLVATTDADGVFTFTGLVAGTYGLAGPVLADPIAALLAIAPAGELGLGGVVDAIPVGAGVPLGGFGFALSQAIPSP